MKILHLLGDLFQGCTTLPLVFPDTKVQLLPVAPCLDLLCGSVILVTTFK